LGTLFLPPAGIKKLVWHKRLQKNPLNGANFGSRKKMVAN
jgi:hypothetical protein